IDECFEKVSDCPQTCRNTDGSYTCLCYPGFEGNGYNCTSDAAKTIVTLTF
ncbi:hypothetical protein ACJMK2_026779, partial [Sinanodonta woodiana]